MTTALDHLTRAALHPLSTVARAVGIARGAAASVVGVVAGGHPPYSVPEQRVAPEPRRVLAEEHPPAAEQRRPEEPGEAFATEATAVTRTSAHGGGGRDEEIDDWYGEVEDDPDEPTGIVEILERGDLPADPV